MHFDARNVNLCVELLILEEKWQQRQLSNDWGLGTKGVTPTPELSEDSSVASKRGDGEEILEHLAHALDTGLAGASGMTL